MAGQLPPYVTKYFWGDDLKELDWPNHQRYITQTILERGDFEAIHWLFEQLSPEAIAAMVPTLTLSPKSRNFWILYLS